MHFVTAPLTVIQKQNGQTIKLVSTLLRLILAGSDSIRVIAACQEGMFETQLSRLKLKRAKTNLLISSEEWTAITLSLLNTDAYSIPPLPEKFSDTLLVGKLVSLEQYDPETGDLIGDELADEVPEFELSVCSQGVLLVVYGTFKLLYKSMEDSKDAERHDYDLLQWVQLQTAQIKTLREKLAQARERASEQEQIAEIKEEEIRDTNKEYQTIILDLEDRFYQALNSKRRKIRELEGADLSDLDALNLEYKKRNRDNLNHVNIEDIMLGDAHKELGKKRPGRRRQSKKVRNEKDDAKEGDSDREQSEEEEENEQGKLGSQSHHGNSENDLVDDPSRIKGKRTHKKHTSSGGEDADPGSSHAPQMKSEERETQERNQDNENDEVASDATIYSESENDDAESPSQRRDYANHSTDYGSEGEPSNQPSGAEKEGDTDYETD